MLRKNIVALILMSMFGMSVKAQSSKTVKRDRTLNVPNKSLTLRVYPLAAIDILDPTILLGVEYRVKERFSVLLNAGYNYFSNYYQDKKAVHGFIIRPSARYYTSENKRFYIEGELHFKKQVFKMYDWLGMDCVNNVPTHYMLTNFDFIKKALGFNAKIGRVAALSKKSNKVSLEYYTGIGIKLKQLYVGKNAPENSCYNIRDFFGINDNQNNNTLLPNFCLGLSVLIQL